MGGKIICKGKNKRLILNWIGTILFICAMDVPAKAEPLTGVATIVDGDTIKIAGQRIRFRGINARAGIYPCGLSAAGALKYRLDRRPVICTARDTGRVWPPCGGCATAAPLIVYSLGDGRLTRARIPFPSSLCRSSWPPWSSARLRTRERPRPDPRASASYPERP